MASIPRSSRKVLPSGNVATAQIPSDVGNVGQGLEARALGDIGKGVSDVANVFHELKVRENTATDLTQTARDQQSLSDTFNQIEIDANKNKVPIKDRTPEWYNGQISERFTQNPDTYGTAKGFEASQIDRDFEIDSFISGITLKNTQTQIKVAVSTTRDVALNNPNEANVAAYKKALEQEDDEDVVIQKMAVFQVEADKLRDKTALENIRRRAVEQPVLTTEFIDAEIKHREKNQPVNFPFVSSEDLNSAKQLAKSTIVSTKNASQEKFDVSVGEATTDVTTRMTQNDIIEDDVWSMVIDVPVDKQDDLGAWRSKWATIVRGKAERTRKIQEGVDKEKREKAYDPALVADLKNRARKATFQTEKAKIREEAATALNAYQINDDDLEKINTDTDAVFNTVVDKAIDERDASLSGVLLEGTSTASLAPWLSAQVQARAAIGTVDGATINELIATFQFVARAKKWAAGQTKDLAEDTAKEFQEDKGKSITVDDVRLLYLQIEKEWLRLSDTEIVERYETWLNSKG